tara:strand:- start:3929 stop:4081 length:153 start_codon:yes stop_codon:yes gene_type:complete
MRTQLRDLQDELWKIERQLDWLLIFKPKHWLIKDLEEEKHKIKDYINNIR